MPEVTRGSYMRLSRVPAPFIGSCLHCGCGPLEFAMAFARYMSAMVSILVGLSVCVCLSIWPSSLHLDTSLLSAFVYLPVSLTVRCVVTTPSMKSCSPACFSNTGNAGPMESAMPRLIAITMAKSCCTPGMAPI